MNLREGIGQQKLEDRKAFVERTFDGFYGHRSSTRFPFSVSTTPMDYDNQTLELYGHYSIFLSYICACLIYDVPQDQKNLKR